MLSRVNSILRKIILPHQADLSIVLVVGQACNLKCRDCGNFCPISVPETKSYNIENVISDLALVLNNVGKIGYLQIQGGEPFIYKDLDKLLMYVIKHKKIGHVEIATNGTVIPKDSVIEAMRKKTNLVVRISDYGLGNPERLKNVLDANGIKNTLYEFAGGKGTWRKLGGGDPAFV